MRNKLNDLFQDLLDLIEDRELADKVLEVLTDAALQGKWKPAELENIPFTLLTDTKGINLIEHTKAVTYAALGIADALEKSYNILPYTINKDWLIAGGILHDVGKFIEIGRDSQGNYIKSHRGKLLRHPISGAILAAQHGLGEEIQNMIANHAKEGEGRPQRIETVLIHQADFATFNPMVMMEKKILIT
jgi:putative nucleotidyltransferase with HDIG domain